MAAYIIATVNITNGPKFGAYISAIAGVAETYGGEYIARGKVAEVLEGDIDPQEIVIVLRFPDAQSAKDYANSPEYQSGKKLREGAGSVETRLLVDAA